MNQQQGKAMPVAQQSNNLTKAEPFQGTYAQLQERINTSILGEDEIADSASTDLASIRRQMRAAAARARDALQKIISLVIRAPQ